MCRKIYTDVCECVCKGSRRGGTIEVRARGLRALDFLSIFIMLKRKAFAGGAGQGWAGPHSRLIIPSTLLFSSSPLNGYLLINFVSFF